MAVLADLGRLPEATAATDEIRRLRTEVESAHLRGEAAWVLGNLAFLSGNGEEGIAEHAQARLLIRPDADLRQWGRFHKASADMRVARGDQDVADLIEEADHALRLAGNEADLRELDLVRAELALNEGDPERAAEPDRPRHRRLVAPEHPGRSRDPAPPCAPGPGPRGGGGGRLTLAALLFEEAGAYRRALDAWRAHAGVPPRRLESAAEQEKSRVGRQPAMSSWT